MKGRNTKRKYLEIKGRERRKQSRMMGDTVPSYRPHRILGKYMKKGTYKHLIIENMYSRIGEKREERLNVHKNH